MKYLIVFCLVLFSAIILEPAYKIQYVRAQTLDDKISDISFQYGVPDKLVRSIVRCESDFDPTAINNSPREYSVGLSQINLKTHKEITKAQAEDPNFALTYLAKHLVEHKGKEWTCYRKIKVI